MICVFKRKYNNSGNNNNNNIFIVFICIIFVIYNHYNYSYYPVLIYQRVNLTAKWPLTETAEQANTNTG